MESPTGRVKPRARAAHQPRNAPGDPRLPRRFPGPDHPPRAGESHAPIRRCLPVAVRDHLESNHRPGPKSEAVIANRPIGSLHPPRVPPKDPPRGPRPAGAVRDPAGRALVPVGETVVETIRESGARRAPAPRNRDRNRIKNQDRSRRALLPRSREATDPGDGTPNRKVGVGVAALAPRGGRETVRRSGKTHLDGSEPSPGGGETEAPAVRQVVADRGIPAASRHRPPGVRDAQEGTAGRVAGIAPPPVQGSSPVMSRVPNPLRAFSFLPNRSGS